MNSLEVGVLEVFSVEKVYDMGNTGTNTNTNTDNTNTSTNTSTTPSTPNTPNKPTTHMVIHIEFVLLSCLLLTVCIWLIVTHGCGDRLGLGSDRVRGFI